MMPILRVGASAAGVVAALIAPQERKTSVAVAAISPRSAADGFALVADGYRIVMVWIPPLVSSRRNGRLILLLLTNALNLADRQGIAVVAQAIKLDLKLTDAQMGMIQGLGFAIFYT